MCIRDSLNFYLDQFDLQRVSALSGLEKYRSRLLFSAGELSLIHI